MKYIVNLLYEILNFIAFTHIILTFLLKIMIKFVCRNKLYVFTSQTSI